MANNKNKSKKSYTVSEEETKIEEIVEAKEETTETTENEVEADVAAETETTEETKKKTRKTSTAKKKKTFSDADMITCRSVTNGMLYIQGKNTNTMYHWSGNGDEIGVGYRDLVSEVRSSSKNIYQPRIIVEDSDFVEQFAELKKFYDTRHTEADLNRILVLPADSMNDEIVLLPDAAKDRLLSIVKVRVGDGTFDSVRKIKIIDEIFGTSLSLIVSM